MSNDYGNKSSENKGATSKGMVGAAHGGGSGDGSGPTGSSRTYPKKVGSVPSRTDFNPQKTSCSSIYVGGV